MKRRQMLWLLGLAPLVFLASCRDSKVPSAPTIVTGKVIDENERPIEGVLIRMSGAKRQGLSATGTFDINTVTDKDGNYSISYVVPRGTDVVAIRSRASSAINDQTFRIDIYKNGLAIGGSELMWGDYGKTTTINFQYIKR